VAMIRSAWAGACFAGAIQVDARRRRNSGVNRNREGSGERESADLRSGMNRLPQNRWQLAGSLWNDSRHALGAKEVSPGFSIQVFLLLLDRRGTDKTSPRPISTRHLSQAAGRPERGPRTGDTDEDLPFPCLPALQLSSKAANRVAQQTEERARANAALRPSDAGTGPARQQKAPPAAPHNG
jgi:hypothetical protein